LLNQPTHDGGGGYLIDLQALADAALPEHLIRDDNLRLFVVAAATAALRRWV